MRRRDFITLFGGAVVTWPLAALAQQPEPMRRIGVLMPFAESDSDAQANITVFRQALEMLGWKDSGNVRIDYRWGGRRGDTGRTESPGPRSLAELEKNFA